MKHCGKTSAHEKRREEYICRRTLPINLVDGVVVVVAGHSDRHRNTSTEPQEDFTCRCYSTWLQRRQHPLSTTEQLAGNNYPWNTVIRPNMIPLDSSHICKIRALWEMWRYIFLTQLNQKTSPWWRFKHEQLQVYQNHTVIKISHRRTGDIWRLIFRNFKKKTVIMF